jgi:hypothetical protein
MSIFPPTYPIYDSVYGADMPTEQLFVLFFDSLPSKQTDSKYYDPEIEKHFKEIGFVEEMRINATNRRFEIGSQTMFINREKQIILRITGHVNKKKDNLVNVEFFYNIKRGELNTQLDLTQIETFVRTKKRANIHLVKSEHGHLDTEEYDLIIPPIDLELNYGESFKIIHDTIVGRLNRKNDKGIILLHGQHGTGKTSYIKYLTSLVEDKDILFIPPSMAEMLSEPSMIPFLMDHRDSILIIEDAERVIGDRESGNVSSAGVSNVLNLTDGILGDCLSIQIIATFNMRKENIDKALLRKGRLIAEHKFEKLTLDETNKLLKHLNKGMEVKEGMTLADIYNIDVEVHKTIKTSKLGF